MTRQSGWRYCHKCKGMFYQPAGIGSCPVGGGHDSSQSGKYFLHFQGSNAITGLQDNWRYCHKCKGLFYQPAGNGSCPAGGGHDASQSGNYWLEMPKVGSVHILVERVVDVLWFDRRNPDNTVTRLWTWDVHGGQPQPSNMLWEIPVISGQTTRVEVQLRKHGSGVYASAGFSIIKNNNEVVPCFYESNLVNNAGWTLDISEDGIGISGPVSIDSYVIDTMVTAFALLTGSFAGWGAIEFEWKTDFD